MTIKRTPSVAHGQRRRVTWPALAGALAAVVAFCGTAGQPAAHLASRTAAGLRPGDLSHFTGTWTRHGATLTINPAGHGEATWRMYEWCSPATPPPCDDIRGNEIINGGRAHLTVQRVRGRAAGGVISDSTDAALNGPVTLELGSHDDLEVTGLGRFCGPSAPVGWCGA